MRRILVIIIVLLISFSTVGAQDGEETLRVFWMKGPSDSEAALELVQRFADEFEDSHPNVTVDLELVDWGEGRQRIHDAVEAGNPPDIAVVGARWVPEFVASGYIEPLDRYITRNFRRQFVPAIINEGAVYQGRTFGLPVATSTRALYYNRDIFEQAGIESPPETWDELLATGQAINALEDEVYGFGLQAGDGLETNTYFYYFVWGNGGNLYNTSNTASALDELAAVEALAFMQRLVEEDATQPNVLDYDRRRLLEEDFEAGSLAMMISGPWEAGRLRRDHPDIDFGVAPLPYNTTQATFGVIDTLVMFRTARNKELAWEYLEFLYDDDRRFEYVSEFGVLPSLQAVAERPELQEDPIIAVFLQLLPDARFEPLHTESEAIAQTVIQAVMEVHEGRAVPQEALDEAARQINDLLQTSSAGW